MDSLQAQSEILALERRATLYREMAGRAATDFARARYLGTASAAERKRAGLERRHGRQLSLFAGLPVFRRGGADGA